MDDRTDPGVTRLGPDSGGRGPGTGGGGSRIYGWEWGPGAARRPGLPWVGVFLLVFGGLLLARQLFPEARSLGSLLTLAVGIAFLIKWAVDRGTGSLYAGAIITALAVPGVVTDAGLDLEGLGTFCFGVAFLFIAAVRAASGGGIGWQAWFGGLLALLGGVNLLSPQVGGLIVPIALVAVGAALIFGGVFRGGRRVR
jgi:type IV secretory pathway VirB2 component (pilin)